MAWPAGITTRTVNFGPAVSFENGDGLTIELRVNASRRLVWSATGTPLIPEGVSVVGNQVEAVLELPVTDQAGYVDGKGGAIDVTGGAHSHYYTATITYKRGNQRISTLNVDPFAVPAGDGSPIDLDLLLPVTTGGATVQVPDTWSTTLNETKALAAGMVWQPSTAYAAGDVTQAPDGTTIRRLAAGTSGTVFDATEEAAWESVAAADGTLLKRDLSATYARRGLPSLTSLKRALDIGKSRAIQVLGDSTGNEAWEWPRLLVNHIAADYPDHTIQARLWDDATQALAAPTTIQTGAAGVLYSDHNGTDIARLYPSTDLTGTLDIRAKVQAPDWTPTASKMIVGAMTTGKRSWALCLDTLGRLQWVFSTDGTALTVQNGDALTVADGADLWVRCVFTPNNGSGSYEAQFYQSTDGITWTTTGPLRTGTAVTLYQPGDDLFYLGGALVGSYGRWVGRIYEVEIRDGLDGGTVAPVLPDLWERAQGTAAPTVGAPVLTLVNGSKAGADIAYLGDATRLPKMTPDYGQGVIFLSDSHNESHWVGRRFLDIYDPWRLAVEARLPDVPVVVLTQNPQTAVATAREAHATRRLDLLGYAAGNRLDSLDTYQAFLDYGAWEADLMADSVHPNAAGQQVWADLITAEFDAI